MESTVFIEKNQKMVYNSTGDIMNKRHQYGQNIIQTLKRHGYDAYFVGGYVRDTILKRQTKDIDLTTSAPVEAIKPLFDKVILTGEKYGTVTVIKPPFTYEVTTYRKDGSYSDHRRPDTVVYTDELKEDLARRDFTINQLVMDEHGTIQDHFNGLEDLKANLIRTINHPDDRFEEDALRMLRAFRFAAKLGFTIEANTFKAIKHKHPLLVNVAVERIQNELEEIFDARYVNHALALMINANISTTLNALHPGLTYLVKSPIPFNAEDAFTVLYLHNPKGCEFFKLSNTRIRDIDERIALYTARKGQPFTPMDLYTYGKKRLEEVNKLNQLHGKKDQHDHIIELEKNLPIKSQKELTFKGPDILKHFTLPHKKHVGIILRYLTEEVVNQRLDNTYETLKNAIETYLEKSENS